MPLIKSSSNKAFKSNIKAEMNAGKPMKQALAIAYAQKRGNKKAKGGKVTQTCPACMSAGGKCDLHAVEHEMPADYQETKDVPMSQGGMAQWEGDRPDQMSKDIYQNKAYRNRNKDVQQYADGGAVDALRPLRDDASNDHLNRSPQKRMSKYYAEGGAVNDMRPLQTKERSGNLELDEQIGPESDSHIDPGISSREDSDQERDMPKLSKALDLVGDILMDRKRRRMAEGGRVEADELSTGGDQRAMKVGSLEDGIDEPTMSDLSNNKDEMNADSEDNRESRGMNISVPHIMSDSEHDTSDASEVEDYKHNDDSLIGEILRERKMRRRG
jgi:hypothetical protein